MMPSLREGRPCGTGPRGALFLWLAMGLVGCDTTSTTAAGPEAPFVLTTRGEPVQANSPPGIEVTLGTKQVRQADEPAAPEGVAAGR